MIASLLMVLAMLPFRVAPPRPTVGDLITVRPIGSEAAIVTAAKSKDHEVIRTSREAITLRSFATGTHPLILQVIVGGVTRWERLDYKIYSVLPPRGSTPPAPLREPLGPARNRTAWLAIAIATAVALAGWSALIFARRRAPLEVRSVPLMNPDDELELALREAATLSGRLAAARLADAFRRYIARTDAALSDDLTTREFLLAAKQAGWDAQRIAAARYLLDMGDLAKFAPWQFRGDVPSMNSVRQLSHEGAKEGERAKEAAA